MTDEKAGNRFSLRAFAPCDAIFLPVRASIIVLSLAWQRCLFQCSYGTFQLELRGAPGLWREMGICGTGSVIAEGKLKDCCRIATNENARAKARALRR
jgi:hypothetical protein